MGIFPMILLYAILLALLIHVLRRQLRALVAYAMLGALLYALWRAAPDLGLAQAWLNTLGGAALLGLGLGFAVLRVIDLRWLVNARRARAHDRVDREHDELMP